jgi:hypothetical protein
MRLLLRHTRKHLHNKVSGTILKVGSGTSPDALPPGTEVPQRRLHETFSKDYVFCNGTVRNDGDGAPISANAACEPTSTVASSVISTTARPP